MDAVSPVTVCERLAWRYAVKKFDPAQKIDAPTWAALEQTLVLAPSSFGLQPWRFVVVADPAVREQLVGASWGQRQIADASHLVVFAIRTGLSADDVDRHLAATAAAYGSDVGSLAGLRKMIVGFVERPGFDVDAWSARQLYIALGMFMESAALMGVDTCPMEGIDPAQYDALLGLPERGCHTLVACTAGYRAADDAYAQRPKVRFPLNDVVVRV